MNLALQWKSMLGEMVSAGCQSGLAWTATHLIPHLAKVISSPTLMTEICNFSFAYDIIYTKIG